MVQEIRSHSLEDYLLKIKGRDILSLINIFFGDKMVKGLTAYQHPEKRFEPISKLLQILYNCEDYESRLKAQQFIKKGIEFYGKLGMPDYAKKLKTYAKYHGVEEYHGWGGSEVFKPDRIDVFKEEKRLIDTKGSVKGYSL